MEKIYSQLYLYAKTYNVPIATLEEAIKTKTCYPSVLDDPKEKAELRKSYKDYNFEKKAFKADLYKAQLLKPIIPNKVEPKVVKEKPPVDVRKLIEDRARAAGEIKRQQIVKDLGDKGLGNLRLKMEGLDE